MSLATIAVIVFIAVTVALFVAVERHSRKRAHHERVGDQNQEREAA
jgi:heme/copper-type cytochrome/quinol oxidase subunit 2